MRTRFSFAARSFAALLGIGTLIAGSAAYADKFQFVYTGAFSSADALNLAGSPLTPFTGSTPFTATALFDDASPNLAAPVGVPGFVAYSPLWAQLEVNGQTYNVATSDQNPVQGVTVAIFDNTTPFEPGHFGIGFLQNPLADGAGFIGDWRSTSTPFNAAHLTSTVFTDYEGVGYGAGPNMGQNVVPIPLSDGMGGHFLLTLGNYDEQLAHGGALNTARLTAVPEQGSLALLTGLGVTGMGLLFRHRKK